MDRYWVGGSGSWNSTTKWSTTSGGASGASVPTASDNAIFDAASATAHYTVTVTDNATCADLTFTPEPADGVTGFNVGINFVIAGTFSTSGTQGNRRVWFRSSTLGLTRDMQIATIGTVTDVDFRDIRVTGTGGTLTGTRIGDLRGNSGITFSTPKNCFRIGTGNWSDDQWSDTSGGSPNTDNFPLAQDTAVFDQSTTGGTHTMNSTINYTGTVDMSARTTALTLSVGSAPIIYGNWTFGSGITISGTQTLTFSGRNTQVITSAGKTFTGPITADSYGGTVELADALNIGTLTLTVTNGTFDTKGYNVTAGELSSSNSNVREIKLGASTVTLNGTSPITFTTSTNLTFDAGTSSVVIFSANPTFNAGSLTFYDVSFAQSAAGTTTINQSNTFNSLSITAPASADLRQVSLTADQTITGTLTAAGASAVRRVMLRSSAIGTTRTLTVGTLSADDCDFRDITIAGTAAGGSPTRAGDCGGNSGVNFPAPKTVYWNLAGTQNWSATGWAPSSGGTPALNEFPLAQDTAVFDEAGSAGTVTINGAFNIGVFDASARTSAMTVTPNVTHSIYGNFILGTGLSFSGNGGLLFVGRGTQTITSNGVLLGNPITIDCISGTVQLADAFNSNNNSFTHTSGLFDAVAYNITVGTFSTSGSISRTLKMGSGTWTINSTGSVWNAGTTTNLNFYKSTADILLSNTSTTARSFSGGGLSYNKLTIGGATGTSTLTFTGSDSFTELASTKTVAHTIALGTTTQTFGKWSVTGTSGNVVTLTGTGTAHSLAGACTDGIDYLAMGSIGFSVNSTAEFYAGANSTGTAAVPVYRTAKPADSTRYWVGGTGNWNDTNKWSTSSGGLGGADLPRSHDDVVFDSLSNATAYTATVNAITGGNRCKALTVAGPLVGNVTLAGSTALYIHDDITLPATGLTRTYTGAITLTGTGAGKTITTNGVALASATTINGVGAEWALADALNMGSSNLTVTNGLFDTETYNLICENILSENANARTIDLGPSTVSLSGTAPINFGTTESQRAVLNFTAGTSQVNCSNASPTFSGNNQTFYNVSFTSTGLSASPQINGANTFNDLSVAGRTSAGLSALRLAADQTINGTLTLSAGTNATMRTFVQSSAIGTTRTLTCAAFNGTDADFRDITIAGAAAPVSGTRLGDCKGNSGITFGAGADKYRNLAGGGNWSATAWATSSGGSVSHDNFPLAQDTCIFEAGSPNSGSTVTINAAYNIGTIDMSARTTNTMTLATGTDTPSIYGNWTNGTGVTLTGTGMMTFAGRGSQTLTSAGRTFTQGFTIDTPNGSVTLQDAFVTNRSLSEALTLRSGTFDANNYNVTISGSIGGVNLDDTTTTRTVAVGSGTWTIAGTSGWDASPSTGLTVTGTGTIKFTSASAKTFVGGNLDYSGITIDQAGAGQLTIFNNNTLANITNSYSATGATTIDFGTTTQRVNDFTATGEAGRVLTIQGSSATSPCTLIHTGAGDIDIDYVTITGVRAYQL